MMTENFPKLISDTKANVQEAQRTLGKINDEIGELKDREYW